MAALLLVGSDASLCFSDHRSRSRALFRRGLLLSGALHLTLLFVFLSLTGRDEGAVRLYHGSTEIFRQPPSLLPPPPDFPRDFPSPASPNQAGIFEPVVRVPEIDVPLDLPGVAPRLNEGDGRPIGREGPPEGPPGPPREPEPERIYRAEDVQVPPVPVESPKPPYPPFAREAGETGRVDALVLVRSDGSVARVEVRGSKLFLETTQETLYRWRFRPARMNGHAVPVWVSVPVLFQM